MLDATAVPVLSLELRLLGRKGTKLELLSKLPLICRLARAVGRPRDKGVFALEYLVTEFSARNTAAVVLGREVTAEQFIRVAHLYLDLQQTEENQDVRFDEVLGELGLTHSYEWFRKGPDLVVAHALAVHLIRAE